MQRELSEHVGISRIKCQELHKVLVLLIRLKILLR
jgi:hypothetical protein